MPKAAIKDNASNNLKATYTFKFKTGTKILFFPFFLFYIFTTRVFE
ncbi:hypothetical protein K8N75_07325 [Methanobacterium sp. VT]|uniref:Uncharacterized protein n=1 Tax=Methanobacterium spitsbergense TaxID=2874285 RepID=A0A8T5UV96_9EURY|nr:hypothetical protein [Methanobacterium spitsbergense]